MYNVNKFKKISIRIFKSLYKKKLFEKRPWMTDL